MAGRRLGKDVDWRERHATQTIFEVNMARIGRQGNLLTMGTTLHGGKPVGEGVGSARREGACESEYEKLGVDGEKSV